VIKRVFIPTELAIDVASVCNARCPFCAHEIIKFKSGPRPTKVMSVETYEIILKQATEVGIKNLRLYWWGEPTLNANLGLFIEMAKKDFYINLSTNAEKIDNFFDFLGNVKLLRYSVDGWDEESFNRYRPPLSYEKVFSNIITFDDMRRKNNWKTVVHINCVVLPNTNFEAYWKLWSGYVDKLTFNVVTPPVVFNKKVGKFELADTLLDNCDKVGYMKQEHINYCDSLRSIVYVAYDGKMALCCDDISVDREIGDIRKEGIVGAYNSRLINAVRGEFENGNMESCGVCTNNTTYDMSDPQIALIKNNFQSFIETLNIQEKKKIAGNICAI